MLTNLLNYPELIYRIKVDIAATEHSDVLIPVLQCVSFFAHKINFGSVLEDSLPLVEFNCFKIPHSYCWPREDISDV